MSYDCNQGLGNIISKKRQFSIEDYIMYKLLTDKMTLTTIKRLYGDNEKENISSTTLKAKTNMGQFIKVVLFFLECRLYKSNEN